MHFKVWDRMFLYISEPACYNTEFCIAFNKQRRVLRIHNAFILDGRKSSEGN